MPATKRDARIAGLLYILMALPAPFALIYLPAKLIVRGDATVTANNVLAHETLFRAGIFGELFNGVGFILLVVVLYRLFRAVDQTQAALMVSLVLVSVAIGFVNVLNSIAGLTLFHGSDFLIAMDKTQRDALGMLFLNLHRQGITISEIFWGLWLFPFGVLVMRSGFIPRILGVLLIVNCFGYVADSSTALLLPRYAHLVGQVTLVFGAGELPMMFCLLIWGAKVQPCDARASTRTT